jgi:hypothetical protein
MYLVELRPGKEELYRTGDDLAAAIRRGDVDVHSRIYHRATSKWISITLHPQYKAIVAQKAAEPLPALERANWTYLNAQSEMLAGAEPQPEDEQSQSSEPTTERSGHPWRRLFALSVAGLALLFGVQLAFSGPRPPWSGESRSDVKALPAMQEEEAPSREDEVVSLASTPAWNEAESVEPAPPTVKAVPASLPRAPKIRMKHLGDALPEAGAEKGGPTSSAAKSVERLLEHYAAAYDSARARLSSGVRVARLNQLLSASRLTPDGGVTETRLGLAGAANFMRIYRQQEVQIERQFQDSFAVLSKTHTWGPKAIRQWQTRSPLKERPALASLSTRLMAGIDSVLGVLDDQAGAYKLGEGTIQFEDAQATRRYGALRRHVTAMIDSAKQAGGEDAGGPISFLLQAIGPTRLPREI